MLKLILLIAAILPIAFAFPPERYNPSKLFKEFDKKWQELTERCKTINDKLTNQGRMEEAKQLLAEYVKARAIYQNYQSFDTHHDIGFNIEALISSLRKDIALLEKKLKHLDGN